MARLERVARGERPAGPEDGRIAAVQALRPGDPGGGRRAGHRARARAAHRRASARRSARRAVSEALRLGARVLRGRRAARRRSRRRRGVRRRGFATRRGPKRRARCADGGVAKRSRERQVVAKARQGCRPMTPRPRPRSRMRHCRRRRGSSATRTSFRAGARCSISPAATVAMRAIFAARGARVLAVDRDATALATLEGIAGIETRARRPRGRRLAACRRTLRRDRRRQLPVPAGACRTSSRPSPTTGRLLYETFARGNEVFGRPSNPDFLLEPGELLDARTRAPHRGRVRAGPRGRRRTSRGRAAARGGGAAACLAAAARPRSRWSATPRRPAGARDVRMR